MHYHHISTLQVSVARSPLKHALANGPLFGRAFVYALCLQIEMVLHTPLRGTRRGGANWTACCTAPVFSAPAWRLPAPLVGQILNRFSAPCTCTVQYRTVQDSTTPYTEGSISEPWAVLNHGARLGNDHGWRVSDALNSIVVLRSCCTAAADGGHQGTVNEKAESLSRGSPQPHCAGFSMHATNPIR